MIREVTRRRWDGALGVIQNTQHVRPDLRVRGADGLVLVRAETLVPGAKIDRLELNREAQFGRVRLDLFEERLLGGGRLVSAHGEAHGELRAILLAHPVRAEHPARVIKKRLRLVDVSFELLLAAYCGGLGAGER